MPAPSLMEGLSPPEIAEAAATRSLTSFLAIYGDCPLILVRIGEADAELATGLGTLGVSGSAVAEPMEFHTMVQTREDTPLRRAGARPEDPAAITQVLRQAHHFAFPLRKSEKLDAISSDRISVGRARNKDLVLRHASVSKFHGWFQIDPKGGFDLTDAGSRNLTRVNGEPLPPREPKRVEPGDRIRFGTVECILCSPETLWSALRAFGAGSG
jgi:hypothetical protein